MAIPAEPQFGYTVGPTATATNTMVNNTIDRSPQVMAEVARLHELAAGLDKVAGELMDKLVPICRSLPPQAPMDATNAPGLPQPLRAPLAETLDDLGTRLFQTKQVLESILQRAEV